MLIQRTKHKAELVSSKKREKKLENLARALQAQRGKEEPAAARAQNGPSTAVATNGHEALKTGEEESELEDDTVDDEAIDIDGQASPSD